MWLALFFYFFMFVWLQTDCVEYSCDLLYSVISLCLSVYRLIVWNIVLTCFIVLFLYVQVHKARDLC